MQISSAMKRILRAGSLFFLMVMVASCKRPSQPPPTPGNASASTATAPSFASIPLLAIGDRQWTCGDFIRFLKLTRQSLPNTADLQEQWRNRGINTWIDHLLTLHAAETDHTTVSDTDYKKWLDYRDASTRPQDLDRQLAEKGLTREDWQRYQDEHILTQVWVHRKWPLSDSQLEKRARDYYARHTAEFTVPEEVRLRHLVTDTAAKADSYRQQIAAGEPFAKLAVLYSASPDRKNGGDLGFFARGQLPAAVERACFDLPIGVLSPVIESEYGYHLCKVLDRHPAGTPSFTTVKYHLMGRIKDEWLAKNLQEWLDKERRAAQLNDDAVRTCLRSPPS